MVSGIDEVGADFKGGDFQPASCQRRHESQGNGGFSTTAFGSGYNKSFNYFPLPSTSLGKLIVEV
jgi:hypothetical protein